MVTVKRPGIGVPDVLGGETDHAPGEIEGVFARHQHPAEPVKGRVGIAPPEALVEGRDEIVVFLPAFVVLERLLLDRLLDEGAGDPPCFSGGPVRKRRRRFEAVQGGAGIPIRRPDDVGQGLRFDLETEAAEPAFAVREGGPDDPGEVLFGEGFEGENAHPGEKRRDDLEGGILRRGADQGNQAAFDVGKKGVLLGLVETVDLVHEEDRPAPVEPPQFGGLVDDSADLLHAGEHRGEADEVGLRLPGQDPGECRLSRTRRTPEDDGEDTVLLNGPPQKAVRSDEVILADVLFEASAAASDRPAAGCRSSHPVDQKDPLSHP